MDCYGWFLKRSSTIVLLYKNGILPFDKSIHVTLNLRMIYMYEDVHHQSVYFVRLVIFDGPCKVRMVKTQINSLPQIARIHTDFLNNSVKIRDMVPEG